MVVLSKAEEQISDDMRKRELSGLISIDAVIDLVSDILASFDGIIFADISPAVTHRLMSVDLSPRHDG